MHRTREMLAKSPWLGWLIAAVCLVVAVTIYLRRTSNNDPYGPERMKEMVTIKFTDTGDEMEIPRGRLDRELRMRGGKVDPSQGMINPKTGQATGFPFNKAEWEDWIARINQEKTEVAKSAPRAKPAKVVRETPATKPK